MNESGKYFLLAQVALLMAGCLAFAGPGCDSKSKAAPSDLAQAKNSDQVPKLNAKQPSESKSKVSKVVFVGQKDCCKCTRNRIGKSWAALQEALGPKPIIPVQRLQIDVDEPKVGEFEKLGKFMVIPALYFLSEKGELVKLLQGEVTREQVAEVL
jgi:hypothetical protein